MIRNLVLILTLLGGGSVYAADTCQALFRSDAALIDGRYGQTSQNDNYLEIEGLVAERGSQLCGPTVIVNALAKFHRIYGVHGPLNGAQRVADLVRRVFPLAGIEVSRQGSRLDDVADVMRVAMREDGIHGEVLRYSNRYSDDDYSGRVTLPVMHQAVRDDSVVILQLGFYNEHGLRTSGHYVIAAGYNPDVPSEWYVLDPLYPTRLMRMNLANAWPDRFPARTFAAQFPAYATQSTTYIEGAIVAHRSP